MELKGGTKLAETLAKYAAGVTNAQSVKVGFLAGASYPDGTSVASVAAFNEFGVPSRGQPPRPFFRTMIADKKDEWGPALGDALSANGGDAHKALELVGEGIKGQLQASIVALESPPLAPSTIKAKGFAKPLIDTGHMLNSVGVEVT